MTEIREQTTETPKVSPQKKEKDRREQLQKTLIYQRDKDREKVKGIFRFYEVPGGSMSFVFKGYKGDQVERYDLFDGQVYTLPLGVAKHLNKNGWYPEYEHIAQEKGVAGGHTPGLGLSGGAPMRIAKKVRRFGFQSLEFVDIEEFNTAAQQVVMVENAGV